MRATRRRPAQSTTLAAALTHWLPAAVWKHAAAACQRVEVFCDARAPGGRLADRAAHGRTAQRCPDRIRQGDQESFVRLNAGVAGQCAPGTPEGAAAADAFLAGLVPKILASPAYKKDGLLIVTFGAADPDPAAPPSDPKKVGALLVSPLLAPGAECQMQVRFAPDSAGSKSARLRVPGPGTTYTAALTGTGKASGGAKPKHRRARHVRFARNATLAAWRAIR